MTSRVFGSSGPKIETDGGPDSHKGDAMSGSGGRTRVAVVTGGAIGIGAAIAEALGRQGTYVVTMDPVVAGRKIFCQKARA